MSTTVDLLRGKPDSYNVFPPPQTAGYAIWGITFPVEKTQQYWSTKMKFTALANSCVLLRKRVLKTLAFLHLFPKQLGRVLGGGYLYGLGRCGPFERIIFKTGQQQLTVEVAVTLFDMLFVGFASFYQLKPNRNWPDVRNPLADLEFGFFAAGIWCL